ncbi:MAG: PD-(D/E)XK nuclease family protein [Planctomycetes bacterium]|nr:PD-(D/E)XK nuclease family protein [Planctomycetota bacterium]
MQEDRHTTADRRRFLGARQPLAGLAQALIAEASTAHGEVDLSRELIVVPGARARRAMLAELCGSAEQRGVRLVPSRLVGLGELEASLGAPRARPLASETMRVLALHAALAARSPDASIAQARDLLRVQRELAAAGVELASVARAVDESGADGDRYRRMGECLHDAQDALAALGFDDPDACMPTAREGSGCVHLVGVVAPSPRQRTLLEALGERVVPWCVADRRDASRFDALGVLDVAAWSQFEPEVDLAQVHQVDGPAEQARAVVDVLARFAAESGAELAADEVTLALADGALAGAVVRELRACGIGVHDAQGVTASRLPPLRLLARLRDFLREPTTRTLRRLAMLADLDALVDRRSLRDFDHWREHHNERETPPGWLDDVARSGATASLDVCVRELVGRLPARGRLADFAEPVAAVLARVFGDERPASERGVVVAAAVHVRGVLEELAAVPDQLGVEVGAADALEQILTLAQGTGIRETPRDDELDLVGWLELPLDSARAAIVIGFNEGAIPSSPDDALLPDSLRRRLGLPDARARKARDRWVLATLLARGPAHFVLGRRDARGEPLAPSSLLLTGGGRALAERVRAFTREQEAPPPLRVGVSRFGSPTPPPGPVAFDEISVTAFKDYLACPYRFWLRHVVELEAVEPAGEALDERSFGMVVHRVLELFGEEESEAPIRGEDAIRARLFDHLDAVLLERAGERVGGGLRIQRRILRERLAWFANALVDGCGDRSVLAVEHKLSWRMPIPGDAPVTITGKIDRIEGHRSQDGWHLRVIDFKTTSKAQQPDAAHRKSVKRGEYDGDWIDLQLPLYDRLLRHAEDLGFLRDDRRIVSIDLGYFAIGATRDSVGWYPATRIVTAIDDAVSKAKEIVRDVRAGKFAMNRDHRGYGGDPLEILCRTTIGGAADDGDDDDEGDAA